MSLIKIFLFIWPFIKEMVLGEKSMREAARDNKMKVLLAIVLSCSLVVNIFSVNRLWTLSQEYLDLRKEHALLDGKYKKIASGEHSPLKPVAAIRPPQVIDESPDAPVTKKPAKKHKSKKTTHTEPEDIDDINAERIRQLKQDFEKIKQREESHNKTVASH